MVSGSSVPLLFADFGRPILARVLDWLDIFTSALVKRLLQHH